MKKKSFTYKVAKQSIIYAITVILVILISISTRLGPSSWKIDSLQGDQNFTRHKPDAAPLNSNCPNCRNNKTSRVRGYKKLMLGDRKDPTWYVFFRYGDIGPTIEEQLLYDRNKNKTYCYNTNAQRISILIAYNESPCPLLCIPYEILFDCENNNMKKCTSQNKKPTTQPSTVAMGIRIRGLKFVLKNDCSTFLCFSAILLCETKISGKSPAVKKRWSLNEFNECYFGYFGYDGELWSDAIGDVETRKVVAISATLSMTAITLDSLLQQTHLWEKKFDDLFCSAVGLLNHSIKLSSIDTESNTFGGFVSMLDAKYGIQVGYEEVVMYQIFQLSNFGKDGNDYYAVSLEILLESRMSYKL